MVNKKLLLTLDSELLEKAKAKSKKICARSIQEYIIFLLQKDLFTKRGGGRPKVISSEEEYLNKFSTPTKETRRIEREIRRGTI